MGGTLLPQQNLVVWLVQPNALAWPAIILRPGEKAGDWVLRLLGHGTTELSPVRSEDMRDFAANLYYAFQAGGKLRSQMALACAEAVELARRLGIETQRQELSEPGFDSLIQSLSGKDETHQRPSKQVKIEESHIHHENTLHFNGRQILCKQYTNEHSAPVEDIQHSLNNNEKRLAKVRQDMAVWKDEEIHWTGEMNRLKEEATAAKMNYIEAESSLESIEIQEHALSIALEKERLALSGGKKDLQLKIMYHRASTAYLEQYDIQISPQKTQVFHKTSVNIAPIESLCFNRKRKTLDNDFGGPARNHETTEGSLLKLPLVPRISKYISNIENTHDASSSSTKFTRKGKRMVAFRELPANSPYRIAESNLGKRMLAYNGSIEGMSLCKSFRRDLYAFHKKHCIKGYAVPYSQGKEIDVFEVLRTVLKWGGYEAVKSGNGLGQLCDAVHVMRGSVRVLKKFYICFLYQYEQELSLGILPQQAKIQEMLSEMKNLYQRSRPLTK